MSILVGFLLAAAAPAQDVAAPVTVFSVEKLNSKEARKKERKMRRKWQPVCRALYQNRSNLAQELAKPRYGNGLVPRAYSPMLIEAAGHFRWGDYGCRKDPDMAIVLLEHIVGPGPISDASTNTIEELLDLYLSRPSSSRRVAELKQILWLHGWQYGDAQLEWTASERRAFLARDDVWVWLEAHPSVDALRLELLFDPASPRFDPAQGVYLLEKPQLSHEAQSFIVPAALRLLTGQGVPKDAARAEQLLMRHFQYREDVAHMLVDLISPRLKSADAALRSETALFLLEKIVFDYNRMYGLAASSARAQLVPNYAAALKSVDAAIANDARDTLVKLAELKEIEAVPPLMLWMKAQLRRKSLEEKRKAWSVLGRLSAAGYGEARAVLDADIKNTGGLVVIENVDGTLSSARTFMTDDDYPPSAKRSEEDGIVSLKLLVGPDGRGIDAIIVKSASEILDRETAKVAIRRIRVKEPRYAGRYLMLTLPDVEFILQECVTGQVPKPEPGAIHVAANRCPQPIPESVIVH